MQIAVLTLPLCTLNHPSGAATKWIPEYEAELGLRTLSSSVADGDITEAWCKFCQAFGREIAPAEEHTAFTSLAEKTPRHKTTNIKSFSYFRSR
ncbi:hypothetical protein ON010_g5609 [Phytophthora cinnamomi]|nr:hypothetical protein ON010_g5609 [Phytophthora cinnamomi]